MDSDNGSCLMEEITENTDIDEMVFDAIKVDVIGFGALNVDKLYKVKNIAGVDGESFIKSEDVSPGGSAANTIIGLSKLGCSTSYIGKIADDEDIYADKGNSGKVLGFVSEEGDRELYVDPGVNDDIHISEINPLNVNQAKILHYTSFVGDSFKAQVELLDVIVDSILLSFDPGALYVEKGFEALRPILERTNILLINERELKILFEDDENLKNGSFRDMAVYLRDFGIDTVVVKRGTEGAYAINSRDDEVKIPAFLSDAVDTTAAGDSFNAGFLYSYLKGFDLAKSVTVANWVASKTVQGVGISSLPEEKELNEFIDSYEF